MKHNENDRIYSCCNVGSPVADLVQNGVYAVGANGRYWPGHYEYRPIYDQVEYDDHQA